MEIKWIEFFKNLQSSGARVKVKNFVVMEKSILG
jgi:hypothetical protein